MHEVSERGDTSDIIEETIEGLNGVICDKNNFACSKVFKSFFDSIEFIHILTSLVKNGFIDLWVAKRKQMEAIPNEVFV